MKTQTEIRERFDQFTQEDDHTDPLGWRREALFEAMEYDTCKDLLQDHVTAGDWHTPDVPAKAQEYLQFAIGKAVGHRGLSASRSVEKLAEWLWVLGDEELAGRFAATGYAQYGAPQLAVLVEAWGVQHDYAEDPEWLRMVEGRPCTDDCMEGCANE